MVWFWHQTSPSFLSQAWYFCAFLHFPGFSKKLHYSWAWISVKSICCIFFLSSVFISMHGFIQAFWLHVITLYSFFNTIPWFDVFNTAQKMKFFIKDFFSKCDQISSFLRIWSHLMKRSLIKNFIFCAMKVLMSITYLLYKFPTNFLHFSIFILSGENGKSLWFSRNFFGYSRSTAKNRLYHYLCYNCL